MPSLLTCRETLFAWLPRRRWSTRVDDLGKASRVGRNLVGAVTAGRLSCRRRCRCGRGSGLAHRPPRHVWGRSVSDPAPIQGPDLAPTRRPGPEDKIAPEIGRKGRPRAVELLG